MDLDQQTRQFFKDEAERRKQNGIRLGRWSFMADTESIATLYEFWSEWVELLGKSGAVKFFVYCMRHWTEALREAKRQQDEERRH